MIGKDLDFVNGWTYEYLSGKSESGFKTLLEQSPLELAVKGNRPNFLISGGRHDTRVHASHSMKFTQALKDYQKADSGYVRFYAPKFTGHFANSAAYQDFVGWRMNVIYWVAMFEQFGWDQP